MIKIIVEGRRAHYFIEAPPPSGTMPRAFMYICMLEVSMFSFVAKIIGLEFGTVLAVWYTTVFFYFMPTSF
jgi:hypothetical protein